MKLARSSSGRKKGRDRKRAAKKRRPPLWAVTLVPILVAAALAVFFLMHQGTPRGWLDSLVEQEPPPDPTIHALRVESAARDALTDLGVAEEQLSIEGLEADGRSSGPTVWEAPLAPGVSLEKANLALTNAVKGANGRVLDALESKTKRGARRCLTLAVAADSTQCLEIQLYEVPQPKKDRALQPARLAVVIGGLGPALDDLTRRFIECPWPLTLAVIPSREASAEIARLARANGKEVLLHLPMEPRGYPRVDPGEGAILVDQSPKEIARMVRSHIRELGGAAGVVNYMGSAGSCDRDVMRSILLEVRKDGLFFVDNSTSVHSVASETAAELDVPCLVNSLFLEEGAEGSGLLERRMAKAEGIALQRGKAVVMGTASAALLDLLAGRVPGYESKGIVLVKASELLEDTK
jgi:polysaccharide deacetylase 2 family uncharacterized protein YibQ